MEHRESFPALWKILRNTQNIHSLRQKDGDPESSFVPGVAGNNEAGYSQVVYEDRGYKGVYYKEDTVSFNGVL